MNQSHPARYNKNLFPIFAEFIPQNSFVLDIFGGTGERLKELKDSYLPSCTFIGTELEFEYISTPEIMLCGNALHLPFSSNTFDVVCTSPTYGNRLADKTPEVSIDKSYKITYERSLGKKLSSDNSGVMQWGDGYRDFHYRVWSEMERILRYNGFFILNIKDHIRKKQRQYVTDWHIETLVNMGFELIDHKRILVSSIRKGRNSELRIPYESVIKFKKYNDGSA